VIAAARVLACVTLVAQPLSAGNRVPLEELGGVKAPALQTGSPRRSMAVQQRKPAVSVLTDPTEPGVYRHAGKRFVVRFPNDWRILRSLEDGEVKYAFTPETSTTDARDLKVSLEVSLLAPDKSSVVAGKDAVSLLNHLMPLVRHGEPGLVEDAPIAPGRLGNLDAATVGFHGTLKDRTGEFTLRAYLAEEGQLLFLVAAVAPKADFETVRPTFEKILAESHFGREPARRPDQSIEARHVVRKYKESVVSIIAMTGEEGATGTGFIISKSGYVLTNHHVIWNDETDKPHTEFFVEWDESLRKRRVPAQLVSYKRRATVHKFYQLWGVDIAMLQIPAGNYEPMPLTSLDDVEVGDPIVTLGFPSRGLLEGVSLTVTTGVVTRFNRGPTGELESLYIDAPFTHGSSGGPCVSLVTGGVIGQNTFGAEMDMTVNGRSLNDLLNYHGVVPIDQSIKEWPTVTELGISYGGEELDFLDAYALSRLYMARGSLNAAEHLAASGSKEEYQNADAHSQWGNVALLKALEVQREQGEEAARMLVPDIVQHFTTALERDPTHEESLTSLAGLYVHLGQFAEATAFADRAIGSAPESYLPYVIRARIALEQKRWDEALKFADRGKAVSHDVVPDPHVIAGMAQYAAGKLEAGRQDYVKASAIHPFSLDARLGVAQYFALKRQTDEAIGEFRRILADFPDNPLVYARMGNHLYTVTRFEEAAAYLDRSISRYVKLGETPAEELFAELGSALQQLKKTEDALFIYVAGLSHHPKGTYAHRINLLAGALNVAARRPGVASAHVRWAQALGTSDELKEFLARFELTRMSLDDIKTMVKLGYPTRVAFPLIVLSPLDFAVRSDDDVKRLYDVEHIPPALIQAIVISQKEQPAEAQDAQAPPARDNSLVGTWIAQRMTPQGMWGMVVQFTADGTFASQSYFNNTPMGATRGTYRIDGQNIVGQNAQGLTFTYPFRIEGDVLVMDMPDAGGPVQFQRRPDR
jgi:S1-C subfamily serine protease/tetratricopeptide (TPR) repeat protein